MQNLTTIGNVYNRVHDMSLRYSDSFVKARDITFTSFEAINIGSDSHPLRPAAQSSIANRLGIPAHYLRKCPADIQALNLNHWITKEQNEELFFRFDGEDVRAIFTPRYIPTDNIEVLEELVGLDYDPATPVHCSLDGEFMCLSIPDGKKTFEITPGDRMTPGVTVSNSEVGLASLSIAAFVLRLKCTNGMIAKTEISASYRHISHKILSEFPQVLDNVSYELGKQKDQFRLSIESKVDSPEASIASFNRTFQLRKEEIEAVEWALPLEYGHTMFNVVNIYTKAAQFDGLSAESSFRLQKVGGQLLGMVK